MVLFIAVLVFYDNEAKYKSLILILAVQLQYLMNHIITKTDYLKRSHILATHLTQRLKINGNDVGQYLIIFIVGLPFILPLATVLLVGALH